MQDVSGKQPADSLRTIVAAQELPQEGEECVEERETPHAYLLTHAFPHVILQTSTHTHTHTHTSFQHLLHPYTRYISSYPHNTPHTHPHPPHLTHTPHTLHTHTLHTHTRAPAKRAFTLSRVEQWVLGGHYSRLDHLQFDLLALLRHARRTSGGRGSQVYKDSVALLRQFVTVRDTVCRNGELLWSPAMEYTHR